MTTAAGLPKNTATSTRHPKVTDAELLASARQELTNLAERMALLDQILAELKLSTDRPRRELGWLAGKGDLTLEQALAPTDEDEIKAWGH